MYVKFALGHFWKHLGYFFTSTLLTLLSFHISFFIYLSIFISASFLPNGNKLSYKLCF